MHHLTLPRLIFLFVYLSVHLFSGSLAHLALPPPLRLILPPQPVQIHPLFSPVGDEGVVQEEADEAGRFPT